MKKLKWSVLSAFILCASLFFTSCLDDGYSLGNFLVEVATINPNDNDAFYVTTDDGKTLWPVTTYYFKPQKELRALVNYTILSDYFHGFDHAIRINSIDTILTKPIAENLGIKNDSVYGKDPVAVKNMWLGDGYLNIYFSARYGRTKSHFINLVPANEGESVYELEFRHNAYDDPPEELLLGVVAFDLSTLPDTQGKTVTLNIKIKTFDGDKIYPISYNSNKQPYGSPDMISSFSANNK